MKNVIADVNYKGYATQDDVIKAGQLYLKGDMSKKDFYDIVFACDAIADKQEFIGSFIAKTIFG